MKTKLIYLLLASTLVACKGGFLDAKPSTTLLVPQTLDDYKSLLDNTSYMNFSSCLGHLAADEYVFLDYQSWQSAVTATERNSYIWAKDIFAGELKRNDWYYPYRAVFYSNNVLEGLLKLTPTSQSEYNQIKGWALFNRAFAFFDLVSTFSKAYQAETAASDIGIPIRLSAGIDEIMPRASVEETYTQVLKDLKMSCNLMTSTFPYSNRNRPSKVAAYAMLARVYLSMNQYPEAEFYADSALKLYDKLVDFNTISATATIPFPDPNVESLLTASFVSGYDITQTIGSTESEIIKINPDFISLYPAGDLRLSIYFGKNAKGNYYRKRGYSGAVGNPYSGLATDEVYLIKAECLARRGLVEETMVLINKLVKMRMSNLKPYLPITATNKDEAIEKVLLERKKELIFRGLRWIDIRRLNKIGGAITLKRTLNGVEYTLPPNDQRYALPIPDDEINRSKIEQNPR